VTYQTHIFSQADYLHDVAAIYGSLSGIENWWIGLSDLGMKLMIFYLEIYIKI
jgi:hypothetical protein